MGYIIKYIIDFLKLFVVKYTNLGMLSYLADKIMLFGCWPIPSNKTCFQIVRCYDSWRRNIG